MHDWSEYLIGINKKSNDLHHALNDKKYKEATKLSYDIEELAWQLRKTIPQLETLPS